MQTKVVDLENSLNSTSIYKVVVGTYDESIRIDIPLDTLKNDLSTVDYAKLYQGAVLTGPF